jgi:hypothetical protein
MLQEMKKMKLSRISFNATAAPEIAEGSPNKRHG